MKKDLFVIKAIKIRQEKTHAVYFVTFTCYKWINLFSITHIYDEIYKWFKYLSTIGVEVCGFVIMPNHIHLLLYFSPTSPELMKVISNGNRFLAYEIIKRLNVQNEDDLIEFLARTVSQPDRKSKKLHNVFQPSYDAAECYNLEYTVTKLNYMHHNPVVKKWNLAEHFTNYPHSSAEFYEMEKPHPFVNLKHLRDLF